MVKGEVGMAYLIRFILLVILIGLSILSNGLKGDVNTGFGIESLGLCVINILFIITIIYAYSSSKKITRSVGVIILESIILVVLIVLSFKPQLNEILDPYLTHLVSNYLTNGPSIYYAQFILGFWLLTFSNILTNRDNRRKSMTNTVRYMRS